jgi:type III secretion protein J
MKRSPLLLLASSTVCLTLGCSIDLLSDLREKEANEVLAHLDRYGVAGEKRRVSKGSATSFTLAIAKSDAPKAWRILREHQLPRRSLDGLGEVFGKPTLVPTATQEQALMRHALAGEIARSLESIEGVREARVHVVIPTRNPLDDGRKLDPPRASVLLRTWAKASITETEVKALVSGSIDRLDPADVRVVVNRALSSGEKLATPPLELASVGPFSVAADSRNALLATLVAAVVLCFGLGLAVILLLRRTRQLSDQRGLPQSSHGGSEASRVEHSLGLLSRSLGQPPGASLRDPAPRAERSKVRGNQ